MEAGRGLREEAIRQTVITAKAGVSGDRMIRSGERDKRQLLPSELKDDKDEKSLGIGGWRLRCIHANPICRCSSRLCPTETISETDLKHTKYVSFLKLIHGNRTQALISFMSDNLGPIFILCNVCSLSVSGQKECSYYQ